MPDLTPETLAELQRLAEAATARPWMVDDEGDDVAVIVDEGDEFSFIQIAADLHQGDNGLADARLIVAAVNALPALLGAAAERDAALALVSEHRCDAQAEAAYDRVLRLRAERDALADRLARVRALPAKHPAGGWYMTSMRDVLAALDGGES